MAKYRKGLIGRRKKEKGYYSKARQEELRNLIEENTIMLKRIPKKSILKKLTYLMMKKEI